MSGRTWRPAVWALVLLSTLAPSHADGNIGCLFSASLCVEGAEWCYDDFAFGKCIPIYDDEPEDGSLYQYNMNDEQLKWFEVELQRLVSRGYRWGHAYTQCVLQAMLYTLREHLDAKQVNTKICDPFVDPKLMSDSSNNAENNPEVDPDETAYIRFTPESPLSNFANEIYTPPLSAENDGDPPLPEGVEYFTNVPNNDDETPSDKLRDLLLLRDDVSEEPTVLVPFTGFRERLQQEKMSTDRDRENKMAVVRDKEKKSMQEATVNSDQQAGFDDEDRLGAHYRKSKTRITPYSSEYITGNRHSSLDAEVLSNALKKYKQTLASQNFPFEYKNVENEIPEPRIYIDEDTGEEYNPDAGSGELDPYQDKDNTVTDSEIKSKNMEYLMNYWKKIIDSKLKPQAALYAEGGPFRPDEMQGSAAKDHGQKLVGSPNDHIHNDFDIDPSYAYVTFKNRFGTDWQKGIEFINKVEKMLGLEKNTFTNPRVDIGEVTFKVEKNDKGLDARAVAERVDKIRDELQRETGAQILSTGIGDHSKEPIVHLSPDGTSWGMELPVLLALIGSLTVILIGAITFFILMRRDEDARRKGQGLASAAEIDAEATRDYQELCRARMSGKWTSAPAPHPTDPPQRITSLSKDPDGNSPSTRSSTSSWSEEPALTNMDISTGHMVLAYMEDHLNNKDRLEQEWGALCAYEAEPCATTAASKPDNVGKNRYSDVLPYDHSRVVLNTLTNHLGSDYINASTITDHDPRNPAYIAAAGPLPNTAPDFWQMVWEQGSVVMVMLTRLTENGQQLCHRYWPEEGSELYHIYEVHLVSEHIWCDDYLVRSFYLKNQRTGETRTVTQFHFLSWPENGVPSSIKALLEFRRKVNKSYRGRSCPIVVHCSDGSGRTGTYCLIDMVLNRMAKGAKEIDIAATLEHIRDQRPRTVATKKQFEFVLMAVAEEVHAILKALPPHLQQQQEKKEKEKEKEKEANEKEKPNN